MDDEFISISAAAKAVGLNKSTLSRQIKAGLIRSQDGKVKLSQVLEDRANNIDASLWEHRQKAGNAPSVNPALHATPEALHATEAEVVEALHATDNEIEVDDDDQVIVDGEAMPISKAKALKETYLARLRKLEFETKSERLIDGDVARKMIFELSRADRDAWTNWPAQVAPLMAAELGVAMVPLAVILEKYVRQHLSERGDPTLR